MSNEVVKPLDTISIMVNNETKEVFMSSGLLRNILILVGGIQDFQLIYTDFHLQNAIIIETLRSRTELGNPNNKPTIDDFEMSIDDGNKLIDWIVEHVLHFFVELSERAIATAQKNQTLMTRLEKLTPSPSGTKA